MKALNKHLIILLLLVTQVTGIFATEQYMFKHLETKDGLSHNQIKNIYKDSRGFLWISTAGGLTRYDGYTYKIFRKIDNDKKSLIDNNVQNVQEDIDGKLWILTGGGYIIYDPDKELFDRNIHSLLQKYDIHGDPSLIYIDNEKSLWVYIIGKGVYKYQPTTQTTIRCEIPNTFNLTDIKTTESEAIFLFNNGEIEVVDKNSTKKIKNDRTITNRQSLLSDHYRIFIDSDNDWWVFAKQASGVWCHNTKKNEWRLISKELTSRVIQDITQDKNGKIWLASDHGGIDIIDKEARTIINLQNNIEDDRSLSNNSINTLYSDDMGIVWVGTYKKGISYYNDAIFKFNVEQLSEFKGINNFNPDITCIAEDKNGVLWLGTNGSGLVSMNRKTGEKKLYQHDKNNPNSILGDVVLSLLADSKGRIWISTYYGGLDCYDGKVFTHYQHEPNNTNSLANNKVWSLAEDKKGNIWIATLGNGLQSLNPQTKQFTSYNKKLTSDYISSICFDKENSLYIGTAYGLSIFDTANNHILNLHSNQSGTTSLSNQNINHVYEDSRGLLWLATQGGGVSILNRKNDELTILKKEDGLVDNIVCSIIEDSNKNMWVTTSNGVSNIMVQTDAKTGRHNFSFYNYDELDGLQNREFNMRSAIRTSQNEILLGGINGFNIFSPETIKYNQVSPKVVFTKFTLFNKEVQIDSIYNGKKILDRALSQTKRVKLKYAQNIFSISFSGMNYILPKKNRYAYKLDGFNNNWMEVDGLTHQVSYTSLPPGSYNFMVKAANSDGYWSNDYAELQIVVEPPIWRSTWAYLCYCIIILMIVYFSRKLLLHNEREKFRLEQVKKEAQHKHEIDDMKLRFFTNISHEFRTPLTLIITPLERIIENETCIEQKKKLMMVKRNATRLLILVNQLLDFRKDDVSQHQLKSSVQDLIPFFDSICQSFMELTDKKNLHLSFTSAEKSLVMGFDEDKMEKILMNLLSNAFKFTEKDGKVTVEIKKIKNNEPEEDEVEIRVNDTGTGISDEDKEHIFERFYQATHKDRSDLSGSGIGLHMVKEFVSLHGGKIRVEDNPMGRGTSFIITLPLLDVIEEDNEAAVNQPIKYAYTIWNDDAESENNEEDILLNKEEAPLILVVDDNDDFRTFMKDCLRDKYRLVEAKDGAEAWKLIPELQPDMIISDIMMPNMDGNQLCKNIKSDLRTSHIPVILLTAQIAEEQKIEGLETGADDYITKPFNLNILLLRINKLIETQKQRQDNFIKQIDPEPSQIAITSLDEKLIEQAIEYVEKNIDRSELSVEELSRELGMSRVHLYKKLTAITGRSPVEFIRIIRLKRAAQMLRESQLNVSEIAYSVGFNNPKYFSRYFKDEFGLLPSDYKNQK